MHEYMTQDGDYVTDAGCGNIVIRLSRGTARRSKRRPLLLHLSLLSRGKTLKAPDAQAPPIRYDQIVLPDAPTLQLH